MANPNLPTGWREEVPGGRLSSPDPIEGGFIDQDAATERWFVVFNRSRTRVSGLRSRTAAIEEMNVLNAAIRRYRTTGAMPAGTSAAIEGVAQQDWQPGS